MSTQFTRLSIINAALLAQGQTELSEENDGSLESRTLLGNWPQVVESEMEDGAMRHNIVEVELASRLGDGKFGFDDRYWSPSGALHVRRVFSEDASGNRTYHDEWYQDSRHVNVNCPDGIWVEVVEVVDPEDYGPQFVMGIQKRMEAIIARALKEEHTLADRLSQEAEYHLQRARTAASNSKGPKPLFRPTSKFSLARFRRG